MTHQSSLSPSSPQDRSAGHRGGRRRTLIPLIAALAVLLGGGITAWFTVGPGAEAETDGEPLHFAAVASGAEEEDAGHSRYERLAESTEIHSPGETHTFSNGVQVTVSDPRVYTPETPELRDGLKGAALRVSIRQQDFSGQDLPLAPAAPDAGAGHDLERIQRVWDTEEDVVPALTNTEGGASFDVPAGTEFLIIEIRTPHIQSGLEFAHWRIDL
jgi:hypothetical protein